jgi:hypothetical protein
MALRTGHGTGAGVPRVEVLPPDELATPNAHDTAANLASSARRGRPFERGNRAAAGRRPRLALLGVSVDATDPRYALALRRAGRYRRRRCAELAAVHGYVSAGAGSLIASASLALCASRYLYEVAAGTGDPDTLRRASALANDARQGELAAWELASREAAARKDSGQEMVDLMAEADRETEALDREYQAERDRQAAEREAARLAAETDTCVD